MPTDPFKPDSKLSSLDSDSTETDSQAVASHAIRMFNELLDCLHKQQQEFQKVEVRRAVMQVAQVMAVYMLGHAADDACTDVAGPAQSAITRQAAAMLYTKAQEVTAEMREAALDRESLN